MSESFFIASKRSSLFSAVRVLESAKALWIVEQRQRGTKGVGVHLRVLVTRGYRNSGTHFFFNASAVAIGAKAQA